MFIPKKRTGLTLTPILQWFWRGTFLHPPKSSTIHELYSTESIKMQHNQLFGVVRINSGYKKTDIIDMTTSRRNVLQSLTLCKFSFFILRAR